MMDIEASGAEGTSIGHDVCCCGQVRLFVLCVLCRDLGYFFKWVTTECPYCHLSG